MKKTKIIGIALSALILGSCATSSDVVDGGLFQKRKYNKGFHVSKKSKIATPTNFQEKELSLENPSFEGEKNLSANENTVLATDNNSEVSDVNGNNLLEANVDVTEKTSTNELSEVETEGHDGLIDNPSILSKKVSRVISDKLSSRRTSGITSTNQTTSESILNLILAVVLVVAIIMLLSFIDGLLGGLLSLVLLIVIVILLLRYFGIV